jgi:hypothetical protein
MGVAVTLDPLGVRERMPEGDADHETVADGQFESAIEYTLDVQSNEGPLIL